MKDFEWLVKSSNLSLVEIKERLDKCVSNNFSTPPLVMTSYRITSKYYLVMLPNIL